MTVLITAVIVVVAVGVGLWLYLHSGPDGGRDPGLNEEENRIARLDRKMDPEALEREYQEKRRPTHEEP